jgi:hypothetical protein
VSTAAGLIRRTDPSLMGVPADTDDAAHANGDSRPRPRRCGRPTRRWGASGTR